MISPDNARRFGRDYFPEAPEKLASWLGIWVRSSPMDGCDGWCLTAGERSIIRINSELTPVRRRFTLAHELAHLILGVPSVVGETMEDMLRSDSAEERRVNELASELLLPKEIVQSTFTAPPVVAAELQKLARRANISEIAAALRVCNLANDIGLINAAVVFFDQTDQVVWRWSKTLEMTGAEALQLLRGARSASPSAFRTEQGNDIIVASILENPYFGSTTMFVQLLPYDIGQGPSPHERRMQLEAILIGNDVELRNRISGAFGFLKTKIAEKTRQQVEEDFWTRHATKLAGTPFDSPLGREYVSLRVAEWFR